MPAPEIMYQYAQGAQKVLTATKKEERKKIKTNRNEQESCDTIFLNQFFCNKGPLTAVTIYTYCT